MRTYELNIDTLLARSSNQLAARPGDELGLRLPLTPNSTAMAPAYDVDLFHGCYMYLDALLTDVVALRFDIACLARNFALPITRTKCSLVRRGRTSASWWFTRTTAKMARK